jgi:hypothetical protein
MSLLVVQIAERKMGDDYVGVIELSNFPDITPGDRKR